MSQSLELLDRPDVLRVLFHPRREPGRLVDDGGGQAVRIPAAPNIDLAGRLFAAGPTSPVILYFHGNGEIAADYDGIAPMYRRMDLSLLVVDYRGYGRSDGVPTSGTLIPDAVAAFDGVPDILGAAGLDPANLLVMGRSLGSAAAIAVAVHGGSRLRGLILESGFADTFGLVERIGGPRLDPATEARDGFNNAGKIETVTVPTLIIHGQEDWIIPVDDGRTLFRRSGAMDKKIVEIPGAGHNDLMLVDPAAYFQSIRRFVDRAMS